MVILVNCIIHDLTLQGALVGSQIRDRFFSVCGWGVNARSLETRFEEERDGCDVSLECRVVEEDQ